MFHSVGVYGTGLLHPATYNAVKDSVTRTLGQSISLWGDHLKGDIICLWSHLKFTKYIYWHWNSITSLRSWEAACTTSMKHPLASFGPMGCGWGAQVDGLGCWTQLTWGHAGFCAKVKSQVPAAAALLPLLSGATGELEVHLKPHFKMSGFLSEGQRGQTQGCLGTPPPHYCLGLWFPLDLSVIHK